MSKEQRVFKNNGKRFEEDFKASFGPHVWTYRPPDIGGGMLARFTQESLCDLIAYDTKSKDLSLFELKSTLGTSVNFRPYEQCMQWEKDQAEFDEWNASLTTAERKPLREKIKNRRRELRAQYKATNAAMIKYHQIKDLAQIEEEYGIKGYIAFTFFKTSTTYALPIKSFIEFWKETTKKSINEKDLQKLVEEDKCYLIEQEYIGRSMKSKYEVDILL